jgi:hypothetical protein
MMGVMTTMSVPFTHGALVRTASLALIAVALGGCGLTSLAAPREWTQTLEAAGGTSHEVVVRDESGRLTNVEFDPAGVGPAMDISNPPGEPNVVIVPWASGSCDVRTEIVFTAAGQGLAGTIKTTTTGQVCDMMAIQHQLRLTAATPLPAAQVTLEPAP